MADRKVLIAFFYQETSHFNPRTTTRDRFDISRGEELIERYAGTNTYVAGSLDVFAREGIDVIPTYGASSVTSGGPVPAPDLDGMTAEMLEAIAAARDADGAYIAFHGAMAGCEEHDPEGRILEQVRALMGERPVVASTTCTPSSPTVSCARPTSPWPCTPIRTPTCGSPGGAPPAISCGSLGAVCGRRWRR